MKKGNICLCSILSGYGRYMLTVVLQIHMLIVFLNFYEDFLILFQSQIYCPMYSSFELWYFLVFFITFRCVREDQSAVSVKLYYLNSGSARLGFWWELQYLVKFSHMVKLWKSNVVLFARIQGREYLLPVGIILMVMCISCLFWGFYYSDLLLKFHCTCRIMCYK